jgi:hypothetical protein
MSEMVVITFEVFEDLDNHRTCFCGSTNFKRAVALMDGKFTGGYSIALAMCQNCRRLFHLI